VSELIGRRTEQVVHLLHLESVLIGDRQEELGQGLGLGQELVAVIPQQLLLVGLEQVERILAQYPIDLVRHRLLLRWRFLRSLPLELTRLGCDRTRKAW
jgi:hypothetical protein